jgi:hypothetical protein
MDLGVRGACREHSRAQREKALRDRRADAGGSTGDENLAPLKETGFQGIGCFQGSFSE